MREKHPKSGQQATASIYVGIERLGDQMRFLIRQVADVTEGRTQVVGCVEKLPAQAPKAA